MYLTTRKYYEPRTRHEAQLYTSRFSGIALIARINNPQVDFGDYFMFELTLLWFHFRYIYRYQLKPEQL